MANSECSLTLINVKLEEQSESAAGSFKEFCFEKIKMAENASSRASFSDAGNAIWIKTEPQDTDEAEFSDYLDHSDSIDMATVKIKDEVTAIDSSPQPSTSIEFISCGEEPSRIKLEPELVVKRAAAEEFFCFHCQHSCKSLLSLKNHLKTAHSNLIRIGASHKRNTKSFGRLKSGLCQEDNKESCSYSEFTSKKDKSLGVGTTGSSQPNKKTYFCPQCHYRTTESRNLKRHILSKHGTNKKAYFCSQCEYSSAESGNLKRHIKAKHTNEKTFLCLQCDYGTVISGNLKTHIMAKHTNEKPYSCCHCEYTTADYGRLKRHTMAIHTKEKPLSCPQCNYVTVESGNLKKHIISRHTESKPYSCPHCDYRTAESGYLKTHIMGKHTNEKPFSCTLCEYMTVERRNLKRHIMTIHTKEKPFSCPQCEYKTADRGNLKNHIKARHGTLFFSTRD